MNFVKGFLYILMAISLPTWATEEDKMTRLQALIELDMKELGEVNVVLDDVFDVFDGLIQARKTTVATGVKQSTSLAPSVTTVITAQDIEAIGARDLDEVLETVPGLHILRNGAVYKPIYTIRGIRSDNNPEVLFLINGIPITVVLAGNRGQIWGGMPVNMISRIEIIRGPWSAVYGADAFSGVVNIFTKTKEEINGIEIGTRVGSFKTYDGWALYGDSWKGVDIAASFEYHLTDGQKGMIQADAQTQLDKVFKTHASFAPGPVNMGGEYIDTRVDVKKGVWQARAGYQGRYHLGTGSGAAQALDPIGYASSERLNADLTYHNPIFTPYWDVTAQWSYFDTGYETSVILYPPGAMGGAYPHGMFGGPGVSDRRRSLDAFAVYSGFQKHLIRIGAGHHHNHQYKIIDTRNFGLGPTGKSLSPGGPIIDISDTPYVFNKKVKRELQYLSLQDTWTMINEWELTAGIRSDDYSDFGRTINPRLALVWQPKADFTSKLMYGRAFRAPSFVEMYNINNPLSIGNPSLKPETIEMWEVAFDYQAKKNLHFASNLFHYQATEKIQLVAASSTTATYQNVGVLEGHGLEVEARWKMNAKSSLLINYSFAKAMDKTTKYDVGNYPRHSVYLRTDWLLIPNWYLDMQAHWIADRKRPFGDPRPAIADYTTIDLTLRYKDIREGGVNVALSVRNLFNADAREPSPGPTSNGVINIPNDLPLAGRSLFVEFRYSF